MAIGAAIAGVVVGVAGIAESERQAGKAEDLQKKESKIRGKEAEVRNARSRRQSIAASRRARASTVAAGEAQGISGGSQVTGALGSLGSQQASNISFSTQLQSFDAARSNVQGQAGSAIRRSNRAGAVGSFGFQASSFANQFI